jgi:hypothetical protein
MGMAESISFDAHVDAHRCREAPASAHQKTIHAFCGVMLK